VRLSELLGSGVVTEDGRELGIVHDVVAVQDGPVTGVFGAALRVDALVVGAHGLWVRLGLADTRAGGPGVPYLRRPRRKAATHEIPWSAVRSLAPERIVVAADPDGGS
jgi:sporulation protein YlmC with PRC-barrel domain